jgi:hypothetical protein
MILQNHRWLPVSIFVVKIAALGPLKRVTRRIFKSTKKRKKSVKLSAHVQKVPIVEDRIYFCKHIYS